MKQNIRFYLGSDRAIGLTFIMKKIKKRMVLFSDAKPLQNAPERNCYFSLTSKGMNRRGQMLTVGRESTGLSESILRAFKATFKRWPDAGDSCDVSRGT